MNVVRAPKRSATHPPTDEHRKRQQVRRERKLSAIGSVARSVAIAGSEVESTVESSVFADEQGTSDDQREKPVDHRYR